MKIKIFSMKNHHYFIKIYKNHLEKLFFWAVEHFFQQFVKKNVEKLLKTIDI